MTTVSSMLRRAAPFLGAAALLAVAAPAEAGRFFLGLRGSVSELAGARLPPGTPEGALRVESRGAGADLQLGYALSVATPLRLTVGGSRHDSSDPDVTFSEGHALLEIDRVWNSSRPARPYLLAGLGVVTLEPTESTPDIRTTGAMATAGAGLLLSLGRRFSLDASVRAEFLNWSEERSVVENPDGSTLIIESPVTRRGHGGRFSLGLLWSL